MSERIFKSFMMGGFECSTHCLASGKRLDLTESTKHDIFAQADYRRLRALDMQVAREAVRWHLVEKQRGNFDFSTFFHIFEAARAEGIQVIWDLLHFGWPDGLDIFTPEFLQRYDAMVEAFAKFYKNETEEPLFFVPVNEISFLSWGGGDVACINPFAVGRGDELKTQLVRCAIHACEAIWKYIPAARPVHIDPLIHIKANPAQPGGQKEADAYNQVQYAAWDMIEGRLHPEIGGNPKYLDIIGVNYYPRNQWIDHGRPVHRDERLYRPFSEMLIEVSQRYNRPVFIAETGTEDDDRADWFTHIANETLLAISQGFKIHGICPYPILNHPGWLDDRHCYNGLWDYADAEGNREIYIPLAKAIEDFQVKLKKLDENMHETQRA